MQGKIMNFRESIEKNHGTSDKIIEVEKQK